VLFELIDGNKKPVTKFPGTSLLWNIYPVSDGTIKGVPRAVFSLKVRDLYDAEKAISLLDDMNKGIDISMLAPFCKGKVSTDRDWRDKLRNAGRNRFEVKYAGARWPDVQFDVSVDRAKNIEWRGLSETWYIQVNNDFKGTPRPVFSFVVKGAWEAEMILDTVKILNRTDRPNITQCPFFCLGKVSTKKDVQRFAEWMAKNSKPEAIAFTGIDVIVG